IEPELPTQKAGVRYPPARRKFIDLALTGPVRNRVFAFENLVQVEAVGKNREIVLWRETRFAVEVLCFHPNDTVEWLKEKGVADADHRYQLVDEFDGKELVEACG